MMSEKKSRLGSNTAPHRNDNDDAEGMIDHNTVAQMGVEMDTYQDIDIEFITELKNKGLKILDNNKNNG